jgi:hypothetical protein
VGGPEFKPQYHQGVFPGSSEKIEGMTQAVEHLLCKREALSSNPSPIKRKKCILAGCQWLMPIILTSHKAGIRRIAVRSQSRQILRETLSWKKPIT